LLDTAPPAAGHNNPPPYDPDVLEALKAEVNQAALTAGAWLDARVIESDEDAQRANDYVRALGALHDKADAARKAAKKPHDEAAKVIQAAFGKILDPLTLAQGAVKSMLSKFAQAKAAHLEQERQAAIAAAEAEVERGRAALAAAEGRNDVIGMATEASGLEAAEKALAKLTGKAAPKVKIASATGGGRTMGTKTVRRASLENVNLAFMHYRDHPEVKECLERIANADLRAAKGQPVNLPGFTVTEERIVA
jgi:uncharacterized protein with von Willebrand factor type A (vWA) domain